MRVPRSLAVFLFFSFVCIHSAMKVREGDTINLTCDRGSVTSETLYAVKWYKDETEFFRYYPKTENQTTVYPIEGFTLETPLPNLWQVVLHNVLPSASGKYTCMVVDYPRYRTIYKSTIVEVASKNDTFQQSHPPHSACSTSAVAATSTVIYVSTTSLPQSHPPHSLSSTSVLAATSIVVYVSATFILALLVYEIK